MPLNYFIREPGSDDFRGPFTFDEIKEELVTQRATRQWEALEAAGQSYRQLVKATGWVPLHTLMGEFNPPDPVPSSPATKPATTSRWLGTGCGCLVLVAGCGFAIFAGLAYGVGKANDQGQRVFELALYGAPIVAAILGASWVAFRHRGPK